MGVDFGVVRTPAMSAGGGEIGMCTALNATYSSHGARSAATCCRASSVVSTVAYSWVMAHSGRPAGRCVHFFQL